MLFPVVKLCANVGWDFLNKNSLFLYRSEKNIFNEFKNKVCSSFSEFCFEAFFSRSYKCFQITRNLTFIKHVDVLLASNALNVNYKIRKIHRNICKD